ncbi:MAG TPA: hypothetical protein VMD07_05800 [Candidatus Acidoferrales bacterium]|nr:hypothetical protein [Candidatus Acidoferrales bacterium]
MRAQTTPPPATPAVMPSVTPLPSVTPTPAPFLVAQPVSFTVTVGGSQDVKILGAVGTLTAQLSSPIAQVTVDQATIHVTGAQLGAATLHITDQNGASVDVQVRVGQPAGTIPATLSLTVTGSPAGPQFLMRQIQAALDRAIRPTLTPGASIAYGPLPPAPQPLQPEGVATVAMPVTVAGSEDTATVAGVVNVTVTNMTLAPEPPVLLFYDDDPEYVNGLGVLFRGTVTVDQPTRLYYYHDDLNLPKDVAIVISSSGESQVQLIDVGAGPDLDVMSVGHQVSKIFMLAEPRNEGVVADVTPATPFVLRNSMMLAGELVAGAVDVRVVGGAPVTVSVIAYPAGDDWHKYMAGVDPPDGHNRGGIFDLAGFGVESLAYSVGGPDATYEYGTRDTTPRNIVPNDRGHDYGDYGVIHRITFDIDNPGDTPQTIYLYEKPLGGPMRSTFIVDGQLKELGCVRVPERYQITAYTMPAQQQAASTVITMTEGGSNYPIEIGMTETPPLPTTPPQSAPDGCFPKPSPSPSPTPSAEPTETPSAEPSPSSSP